MSLFTEHTKEQQAHSIAAYLPGGKLWHAKHIAGKNLRSLLEGLGVEFTRVEAKMNEICRECDISTTTTLIENWEKMFGIPDDIIGVASTLAQRRLNILFKLSVFGASSAEDWERIAAVLGFVVIVGPADGGSDIPYTDYRALFVIVVTIHGTSTTFPLTFPVVFGGEGISILKAMYEKIKPAVCTIIYRTEA